MYVIDSGIASQVRVLSGSLLLMTGAYQLTPLKRTSLRHCRTPLGFLMTEWREGTGGAFVMGASWPVLPLLLLGIDGAAVLVRSDEPSLGRRTHGCCCHREDGSGLARG